jgi:hypothetical protein
MLRNIREFFAFLFGRRPITTLWNERGIPGWLLPDELEREREEMRKISFGDVSARAEREHDRAQNNL